MRLFISCFIPEKISTYLRELSLLLPEGSLTIPQKQFDLTMRFIGEVPESHVAEIENLLKTVQAPSFEASLEKIGFFSKKTSDHMGWSFSKRKLFHSSSRRRKGSPTSFPSRSPLFSSHHACQGKICSSQRQVP